MSDIFSFFTAVISQTYGYPRWLWLCLIAAIIGATQGLKLPIKHFTKKIQNENARKKVNVVIMLLPNILAIGFVGILVAFGYPFSLSVALICGSVSQVIYQFAERLIKRIKDKKTVSEEDIKQDFKDAVDATQKAEDEFSAIVDKIKNQK